MTDHAGKPRDLDGLSEREAEVYRLRHVNRLTQAQIAERIGVSQQQISHILATVKAKLPPINLDAIRQQSITLYEDVIRRSYLLAEMNGAPVTAGKDGEVVYDPDGGAIVRDYALRMNALNLAIKADAELRKLTGADAASKTEVTGSVRYEVIGVNTEDLT